MGVLERVPLKAVLGTRHDISAGNLAALFVYLRAV